MSIFHEFSEKQERRYVKHCLHFEDRHYLGVEYTWPTAYLRGKPDASEGINYCVDAIRYALEIFFNGNLPTARILDIGSGRGYGIAEALYKLGARNFIAMDLVDRILRSQWQLYPRACVRADGFHNFPFKSDSMDLVVSTGAHDLSFANFPEVKRVLKKRGIYLGASSQNDDHPLFIKALRNRFRHVLPANELLGDLLRIPPKSRRLKVEKFISKRQDPLPLVLVK